MTASATACLRRSFGKALSCLQALRRGCIEHSRPQTFNDSLALLTSDWDAQANRKAFWVRVHGASLQLISSDEVPSSTVSPAEAQAWFRNHSPAQKVRLPLLPPCAAVAVWPGVSIEPREFQSCQSALQGEALLSTFKGWSLDFLEVQAHAKYSIPDMSTILPTCTVAPLLWTWPLMMLSVQGSRPLDEP